jgi:hypothetical protein
MAPHALGGMTVYPGATSKNFIVFTILKIE